MKDKQRQEHFIAKCLLDEYYYHDSEMDRLNCLLEKLPDEITEHQIRRDKCLEMYNKIRNNKL